MPNNKANKFTKSKTAISNLTKANSKLIINKDGENVKDDGKVSKRFLDQADEPNKKRSAFGDITNALTKTFLNTGKTRPHATVKQEVKKVEAVKAGCVQEHKKRIKKHQYIITSTINNSQYVSSSQESNKSEEYETANETSDEEVDIVAVKNAKNLEHKVVSLPDGVTDYDKQNANDPFEVSEYVEDIFQYYKEREVDFLVEEYMAKQPELSRGMRSILVDWMVEVQESFELNHETLYLSVKLVDLYLSKCKIKREMLQLVGATALFISCKFDERCPPQVDDFLYICDDAYTAEDLLGLEIDILKKINFDLGAPLSYRFLRRYSRTSKLPMETLTLARYILELSLQEYEMVKYRESVKAGGALLLALSMINRDWTPQLQYYSGYSKDDLIDIGNSLNKMLHQPVKDNLKNIRSKYSHKVFFQVAKTSLVSEIKKS